MMQASLYVIEACYTFLCEFMCSVAACVIRLVGSLFFFLRTTSMMTTTVSRPTHQN